MGNLQVVKKVGAYNEDGFCIIPLKYDSIKKLKSGVYIAKNECMGNNPPFKDNNYLYTEKGELIYQCDGKIAGVLYDVNEKIIALQISNITKCEWHIVEIDLENNIINMLLNTHSDSIKRKGENLWFFDNDTNKRKVFSLKSKKIILCLDRDEEVVVENKKGFILSKAGLRGFYNEAGEKIIEAQWYDIILYEEFIGVVKKVTANEYNYGLYTYEGKKIFPCKYWGMEYIPGITPELCKIDGAKVWLFNTHRKENGIYYDELIKADGEAVVSISGDDVFMSDVSIRVYEGNSVIVKQKNKATLYKLEMDNHRKIKAVVVCEANKIEKLHEYGQYRVYKGKRKGVCNKNGTMIEPLKFKSISERIEDYFVTKN